MCAMNPRLLRPLASGFNPRQIAGLLAWYDAADASTLTIATGVSAWADKSGNGYTLRQSVGNNQPASGTRTIGDKNALDFDGSNDVLSLGNSPPGYLLDLATSRALSVFVVCGSDDPDSVRRLVSLQRTGKNANDVGFYFGRHITGTGTTEVAAGAGDSTSNDEVSKNFMRGFSDPAGDASIYSSLVSAAADTLSIHKNGNAQSLATRYGTATAADFLSEGTGSHTLDIGSVRSFNNNLQSYWDGAVGEVLIYTRAVSAAQRTAITRYLGSKWGITVT